MQKDLLLNVQWNTVMYITGIRIAFVKVFSRSSLSFSFNECAVFQIIDICPINRIPGQLFSNVQCVTLLPGKL